MVSVDLNSFNIHKNQKCAGQFSTFDDYEDANFSP